MFEVLEKWFSNLRALFWDGSQVSRKSASEIAGIGVRLVERKEDIVVAEVFEGGPADKHGLPVNSIIAKVNGRRVYSGEMQDVVGQLLGPEPMDVRLEVQSAEGEDDVIVLPRMRLSEFLPQASGLGGQLLADGGENCPQTIVADCDCPDFCDQSYCTQICTYDHEEDGMCWYICEACLCGAHA